MILLTIGALSGLSSRLHGTEFLPLSESRSPQALAVTTATTATTANFVVLVNFPGANPKQLADQFEAQRTRLQSRWLPDHEPGHWGPRCEVVVHGSEAEYVRQVGMRAAMTRGCCRIDVQQGRVVRRRLDLLADPETGELTALAHELTHVVLADRFAGKPLPRWADEGMALLADGDRKRALHLRHLNRALAGNRCPRVREVLASHRYPPPQQMNAFYGQSLSMVRFLTERGEPAKVVELLTLAMEQGFDRALRNLYGIDGAADFERQWQEYARSEAVTRLSSR